MKEQTRLYILAPNERSVKILPIADSTSRSQSRHDFGVFLYECVPAYMFSSLMELLAKRLNVDYDVLWEAAWDAVEEMATTSIPDPHIFKVIDGVLTVTPPLRHDTPDPLVPSIKKWEAMVEYMETTGETCGDGGTDTCACCKVYISKEGCFACPVYEYIKVGGGGHFCEKTPYDWWKRKQSLASAKAMLSFLEEVSLAQGGDQ